MGSYRGYLSEHVDTIIRMAGRGVPASEIALQLYHAGVRPPWSGGAVLKSTAVRSITSTVRRVLKMNSNSRSSERKRSREGQ